MGKCSSSILLEVVELDCVRGSVMAIEPWSSFRAIDLQILMHDVPGFEGELQGVARGRWDGCGQGCKRRAK